MAKKSEKRTHMYSTIKTIHFYLFSFSFALLLSFRLLVATSFAIERTNAFAPATAALTVFVFCDSTLVSFTFWFSCAFY